MRAKRSKWRGLRAGIVLGAAAALSAPAWSFDFALTDDIKGSLITLITGGLSQRLREQNAELVAAPGTTGFNTGFQDAHLGDLNYNRGDLFALYVKGSHELLLNFPDKYKFFFRTGWILDGKAGDTEFVRLSNQAYTQAAHDLRLYDLWVSKDFDLFGRASRIRLGRQTINWGESLFVAGGVNATAAIDQYRLTYPGVPLKEVVLPAEMVSWALSPALGVNVETYYQFDWNPNRLVPVGTFFSTSDYIGQGGGTNWFFLYDPRYAATHGGVQVAGNPNFTTFTGTPTGPIITNPLQAQNVAQANNFTFCAVAQVSGNSCPLNVGAPFVGPDQTPSYGGQFGISAHYKPQGSALDFGLYVERFHEKQPFLKYVANANLPLGYGQQLVYPQGHMLYGVSGSALVGQWAIGSELSYRPKDPILVDPFSCADLGGHGANCFGNWATYRDAHKFQWNTTWWRAVNPSDNDVAGWLVRHAGAQASGRVQPLVQGARSADRPELRHQWFRRAGHRPQRTALRHGRLLRRRAVPGHDLGQHVDPRLAGDSERHLVVGHRRRHAQRELHLVPGLPGDHLRGDAGSGQADVVGQPAVCHLSRG
jgi:hypothetical protein